MELVLQHSITCRSIDNELNFIIIMNDIHESWHSIFPIFFCPKLFQKFIVSRRIVCVAYQQFTYSCGLFELNYDRPGAPDESVQHQILYLNHLTLPCTNYIRVSVLNLTTSSSVTSCEAIVCLQVTRRHVVQTKSCFNWNIKTSFG